MNNVEELVAETGSGDDSGDTARKEIEAAKGMLEKNVELDHASRMKSEFLATLSHELRTPLNAILGFSEALKDGLVGPMSEIQREHIGEIFKSGQRLLSLINDMQLAGLHGGSVALTSAPLPPGIAGAARAVTSAAGAARKRVALVVEDDDPSANLLRMFLEAEGFAVLHAISAEDALVQASRQVLALITLDLGLYGMNGWQFLEQLRKTSEHGHAPVVVISGRPVGNLAQTRGAAAVLLKPVSRDQLNTILANLGLLQTPHNP